MDMLSVKLSMATKPQILFKGHFMGKRFAFLSTVFAILLMSGCSNKADLETAAAEKLAKETQTRADKLALEQTEADRLALEQEEADRLSQEQVEADSLLALAETERLAQEELEMEATRLEEERQEDVANLSTTIDDIQKIEIVTGSTDLTDTTKASLEAVISFLKKYPESTISVNSYTDAKGSESINLELSQTRADNIKDYIVSQEISEDRVNSMGFGETNLLNPENPNSLENRRVEIELNSN